MEDFYEHIDDYKNGLLTGEVLTQFEAAMGSDASLKLAVDNYASAKSISEGLLELDMMETLNSIKNGELTIDNDLSANHSPSNNDRSPSNSTRTSITEGKIKTSVFNLRNLMAAASVIGVMFFAGWWMMGSNADLERKEYVLAQIEERGLKPIDPDATKSLDTIGMTPFEKGKHFYSRNYFEESIIWLEQSVSEAGDTRIRSLGHYWLGHAYIQVWRVEDATEVWKRSKENETSELLSFLKKTDKN